MDMVHEDTYTSCIPNGDEEELERKEGKAAHHHQLTANTLESAAKGNTPRARILGTAIVDAAPG